MRVDQLVHHGDESLLQIIVFYKKHVAFIFILDVGTAAPCGVFVSGAAVYPALKGIAALAADDLPGEGVAIVVFVAPLDDTFFRCPLVNKSVSGFKVLPADDCLVMILDHILCLLAVVVVSDKA